jgi:hypothetical protein
MAALVIADMIAAGMPSWKTRLPHPSAAQ